MVRDWRAWHELKGLTLKSPVSEFMSYPLTVYYGLTKLLGLRPRFDGESRSITVHLVGAELELDLKHLFVEILCILRGFDVTILMFAFGGDSALISKEMQSETVYKVASSDNVLKVRSLRMAYCRDNVKASLPKKERIPDLLVAPNAGFEAHPQRWEKALKWIYRKRIASLFTECSITTVHSAEVHLRSMFGAKAKFDQKYESNPFRSSLVSFNPVSRFCSIRNAWIYTLFTHNLRRKK